MKSPNFFDLLLSLKDIATDYFNVIVIIIIWFIERVLTVKNQQQFIKIKKRIIPRYIVHVSYGSDFK